MGVPPFVINHGEKVLVALVALGSLYWVASTITNEETASDLTPEQVTAAFNTIEEGKGRPGRLNPIPAPDYAAQLRDRLTVDLGDTQVIPFIHEHPDVRIDVEGGQLYPYIYVVGQPTVTLQEGLGSLTISVREAQSSVDIDNQRITDARNKTWSRSVKEGEIQNTARRVGMLLEMRIDEGEWAPLRHPDTRGGVLLSNAGAYPPITLERLEEWRRYEVRARQIVIGTGFLKTLGGEVIVVDGATAGDLSALNWNQVRVDAAKGEIAGMLKPVEAPIPGLSLDGKERVFVASPGEPAGATIKASVVIALTGVSTIANPPEAKILVMKRLAQGWTPPKEFKVPVGAGIGGPVQIVLPWANGQRQNVNLKTPYTLDSVKVKDVTRTFNYEVKLTTNLQAGGKKLVPDDKTRASNIAVITNTITGDKLTLVKLEKNLRQSSDTNRRIHAYTINASNNNELAQFATAPQDFEQPVLTPVAPIPHQPGQGPILAVAAQVLNMPETTYYELPDGRLLYIDPLNDGEIKVVYKAGANAPAGAAVAPAGQAAPQPAARPAGAVPVPIPGMGGR